MTTIIEYLRCKYGTEKPTAMLKTEAKAFGMPYPLKSGWLAEFGGMEITPGMMHRLRDGLTKRGGEKASAGLIAIGAPVVAGPSRKAKPSKEARKRERQAQKVRALEIKLASPRLAQIAAPQRPAAVYTVEGIDVRSAEFLCTWAWRELRYATIKRYGPVCQCCGATPKTSGEPIQVDHIKPRSLFPELAMDPENLGILCAPCNQGKSNKDFTDWRP
jgi:hypothetical protein